MRSALFAVALTLLLAAVAAQCPTYVTLRVTGTAANAAGLQKTFAAFERILGDPDNASNAGNNKGRRRINWDADVVPFDMPGNFFDVTVTRGALLKTKTGEFRVSNDPNTNDNLFDSILPKALTSQFRTFSPKRLFTPLNKNKFTLLFKVPQQNKRATVTGFGGVFVDVDKRRATNIKYFDRKGCLIARLDVPPKNKGLSFAGLVVLNPKNRKKQLRVVSKVVVKLGTISVWDFARRYSGKLFGDVVVMDDFLYGEPIRG